MAKSITAKTCSLATSTMIGQVTSPCSHSGGLFHSSGFSRKPIASSCRFGLSYTTFSISDLVIDTPSSYYAPSFSIQVRATVTNTGPVVGSHVVQLYISLPETSLLTHPSNQLRAFAKVRNIAPGTTFNVKLTLNKYAFSYWDDRRSEWVAEKGEYGISVGSSSADLPLRGTLELTKGFTWAGL